LMREDDDAGGHAEPYERAGERDHARFPGEGGGPVGASREQHERRAADDDDASAQMNEAREQAELGHSQSKLSVTGFENRPTAAPMVFSAGAPSVSVTFTVSSGSVMSAP